MAIGIRFVRGLPEQSPPFIRCEGGYDRRLTAPKGFVWLLECIRDPHRIVRRTPAFLVPQYSLDSAYGWRAYAPNEQYRYESGLFALDEPFDAYSTTTLFWQRGQPKPKKIPLPGVFYARFSPDSRFLFGYVDKGYPTDAKFEPAGTFYLVECKTRKISLSFRPEKTVLTSPRYGWYPDSRHVWYEVKEDSGKRRFYKLNIYTGKRSLLRGTAQQALFSDWDLLDPRYCGYLPKHPMAYALNHAVRVRVERTSHEQVQGDASLYVEWRNGQKVELLSKGAHSWTSVVPLDITDDGQWVLVEGVDMSKGVVNGVYPFEVVVWNTRTKQRYVYFQATPNGPSLCD